VLIYSKPKQTTVTLPVLSRYLFPSFRFASSLFISSMFISFTISILNPYQFSPSTCFSLYLNFLVDGYSCKMLFFVSSLPKAATTSQSLPPLTILGFLISSDLIFFFLYGLSYFSMLLNRWAIIFQWISVQSFFYGVMYPVILLIF
jgi:hypothetical protein